MRLWNAAPWMAAALAVAALAAAFTARADEPAPAAPLAQLRIAVVDTAEVLRRSEAWRDAAEERLRQMDTMRRTLNELGQQVQVLRNEQENLPPGSDERTRVEADLAAAVQQMQTRRQEFEAQLAQHYNEEARAMFARITGAAAELAKRDGIALVLKRTTFDPAGPQTVEESLLLATTEVLYADPALDITDAVIERINADYSGPIEAN